MDLTIPVGDTVLNIRVALLIKNDQGYIFEKYNDEFCFVVGGRVKVGESSEEALKREVFEELGISFSNFTLKSIIENFYLYNERTVYEICFVYQTEDIFEKDLGPEFLVCSKSEIADLNLRPEIMKKVILDDGKEILHLIVKNK